MEGRTPRKEKMRDSCSTSTIKMSHSMKKKSSLILVMKLVNVANQDAKENVVEI